MNNTLNDEKKVVKRKRKPVNKKWLPSDEACIINYLKRNRNFEKPNAQIYYKRFLDENDMDSEWKLVRSKVRNMRTVYRRAKEHAINRGEDNDPGKDGETVRDVMLKICWYLDDFDLLFPNDTVVGGNSQIANTTDDDSSNQYSFSNYDISSSNFIDQCLLEPAVSLSSKSIRKDILAVQTGMFNFKRQKHDEDTTIKQQELELLREKLNFEKEKFREEIRLKEKEIETQERLKIMELQMKERIAMKELELKERIALRPMGKHENYDNVYHHMT